MSLKIIRCHPSRFEALVAFVAHYNPQPEHHIGYFGLTPEDIRLSLRMFNWSFDRAVRLAISGNRIVGVLAADIDKELGRAWLYGPIIAAAQADSRRNGWAETADALYTAVAARLPAGIGEHEMFVDTGNANCRAFAERHGFTTQGEWAIYTIVPDRLALLPEATADNWDERFAPQLAALHDRLFPGSNYTLAYMRQERAEKGALLLVATEGEALTGYFFGHYDAESGEGYVDLVGVEESRRRTGLGRRLMLAGLSRLRGEAGLRQVNLSVAAGNEAALALYDSLGFVRERDMIAFRRREHQEEENPQITQSAQIQEGLSADLAD